MKFTRLIAAATLLILSTALTGLACDCLDLSETESFNIASAVFVGQVIKEETERPNPEHPYLSRAVYTFRVDRVFKGNVAGEVKVESHLTDCDPQFVTGTVYMVYVRESEGNYFSSSCWANYSLPGPLKMQTNGIPARAAWFRILLENPMITASSVVFFVSCGLLLGKVWERAA